jgi:hypothetical protein
MCTYTIAISVLVTLDIPILNWYLIYVFVCIRYLLIWDITCINMWSLYLLNWSYVRVMFKVCLVSSCYHDNNVHYVSTHIMLGVYISKKEPCKLCKCMIFCLYVTSKGIDWMCPKPAHGYRKAFASCNNNIRSMRSVHCFTWTTGRYLERERERENPYLEYCSLRIPNRWKCVSR